MPFSACVQGTAGFCLPKGFGVSAFQVGSRRQDGSREESFGGSGWSLGSLGS